VLKIIFLIVLVIAILASVVLIVKTKNSNSPSSFNTKANSKNIISKLSVSGLQIVNEEGKAVRLRGVNFEDPFVLEKEVDLKGVVNNHFSKVDTDFERVKAMGANVVRITVYPGYYFLVGGDKYLVTYLDPMINLAEQNGLYVIISYHVIGQPGGWYESDSDLTMLHNYPAKVHYTDSDMAVAFWNKVSDRYGQKKHVLFEIYNEPTGKMDPTDDAYNWAALRPFEELLIATVRQHSNNIILGSGPKYTSDLSEVPTNPYSDANLVYVAHIYPNTIPKGEDQIAGWDKRFGFLTKTYPVIISEWGFHNGTKDPTVNGTVEGFAQPFLDYLDQKNLPWVAYVYHPPDDEPPMLESDWTTLNEFGQFVKKRLEIGSTN